MTQKLIQWGGALFATCLFAACGGGGSSSTSTTTTTTTSSSSSATNCQNATVPLTGGLQPGMTTMAALGTNYITSVTASGSNAVIVTKDVPNHASPYCPTSSGVGTVAGCTNESAALSNSASGTGYYSGGTTFSQNPYYVHVGSTNTVASPTTTLAYTLTIPLQPTCASASTSTSQDSIGVAKNGIVFFNQYAAGNATLTNEIQGFDRYGGHPAQSGNYHYHMEPRYLTTSSFGGGGSQSALIGWALDGFPVYGPTNSSGTPVSLDACNGEFHATTEYPSGIYHYHVTSTSPYIIGCYAGTPGTKVMTP